MFQKLAIALLLCSVVSITADNEYDGYKVYDINAKNEFQKGVLLRLSANKNYDFFDLPKLMGKPARVMVKPDDQATFEAELSSFGMTFTIVNDNFGKEVENEEQTHRQISPTQKAVVSGEVSFTRFLRFPQINAYLNRLATAFPKRVTVKTVGKSYRNRDLKTITISNGDGRPNKKVILVDGGIHAREWIAPAGAVYIINQLVENFAANSGLLKDYDWVVLPVVNPDGYEYSHTSARMWRKTRKPVTNKCRGTDANRNFNFHWGKVGASSQPCEENYMGKTAFSEPETQVLRDIMMSFNGRAKMYLTLHAYGNYLLYPWGYTSGLPSTWRDLDEVARAGARAIKTATGTEYTVGSSTNVLYAAAGGSDDFALGVAKIPISITMELPAGPGVGGFGPKPSQIKPFVSEAWIGIKAMAQKVIAKY